MKNIIAASILAVGLVVFGWIIRPIHNTSHKVEGEGSYRYQFINNEQLNNQMVFDKKTGITYSLYIKDSETKEPVVAWKEDWVNGRVYSMRKIQYDEDFGFIITNHLTNSLW